MSCMLRCSCIILGDHQLSVGDLQKVQKCIWDARSKWYNIGLELGIDAGTLDAIAEDSTQNPDRCFRAMLTKWLRQDSPKLTWTALAVALRSSSVGHGKLAEQALQATS